LIIWLHLATLLLAALFTYLALERLEFRRRGGKWFAVVVFILLSAALIYLTGNFLKQTVRALPEIAEKAIPSMIEWARQRQIELPFTDYDSLKDLALDTARNQAHYLAEFVRVARGTLAHLVYLLAGAVVAISIFLDSRFELGRTEGTRADNLYSAIGQELGCRFAGLYRSFVRVMGAQIFISLVNTALTAVFVVAAGFPYGIVVIGVTFLCGLLPVVGNLISNFVIVIIGFTLTPRMALIALVYLVVIHKLEYFLNSKIVGLRIRNPLWLTLLGLVVFERLLGIPGMVLAPVFLYYIKSETSAFPAFFRPRETGTKGEKQ
jgi:predicted PurR-regulated permease PerM